MEQQMEFEQSSKELQQEDSQWSYVDGGCDRSETEKQPVGTLMSDDEIRQDLDRIIQSDSDEAEQGGCGCGSCSCSGSSSCGCSGDKSTDGFDTDQFLDEFFDRLENMFVNVFVFNIFEDSFNAIGSFNATDSFESEVASQAEEASRTFRAIAEESFSRLFDSTSKD
jgi:hypothetical protein